MAVGLMSNFLLKISSMFEAGSVLTKRTFLLKSAKRTDTAHEVELFPTPPFPVKKGFSASSQESSLHSFSHSTLVVVNWDFSLFVFLFRQW